MEEPLESEYLNEIYLTIAVYKQIFFYFEDDIEEIGPRNKTKWTTRFWLYLRKNKH